MKRKICFDESSRRRSFGLFSACLCTIKYPLRKEERGCLVVDKSDIKTLRLQCGNYEGNKTIHSNMDKKIKRPYGQWQNLICIHTKSPDFCSFSFKDDEKILDVPENKIPLVINDVVTEEGKELLARKLRGIPEEAHLNLDDCDAPFEIDFGQLQKLKAKKTKKGWKVTGPDNG